MPSHAPTQVPTPAPRITAAMAVYSSGIPCHASGRAGIGAHQAQRGLANSPARAPARIFEDDVVEYAAGVEGERLVRVLRIPLIEQALVRAVPGCLVEPGFERGVAPAQILDLVPHPVGMRDVELRVEQPERVADDVAEDEQPPLVDLPLGGIAAEFDPERRAIGAKAAMLGLVARRIGDEETPVFFVDKVVGALRQAHLDLGVPARRLAHREVGHRVVTEQHHRVAIGSLHGGVERAAAAAQQQEYRGERGDGGTPPQAQRLPQGMACGHRHGANLQWAFGQYG